ncbi:acyl-CoA dehydrogenase family protein [Melaminivora sp.]|uniref:acyl-CoA dehydrogenase family protein n=1 Tax=Melaminivora sp. TaxID=1933032 RepID=UPI0028AAE563|nr:acyl-CoA dehydrogenase family protein [Melaminivora sp.]
MSGPPLPMLLPQLRQALALHEGGPPGPALRRLVAAGLDGLAWPASGQTLARWQALAAVGGHDLSLAKLYEGHTDALAILHELDAGALVDGNPGPAATWAVWAAEAPGARVRVDVDGQGQARISGTKAWCSGAQAVSHALLTAWPEQGAQPQLVAVALEQPGVSISEAPWQAVGMAASASADVSFIRTPAALVGAPGDYLARPGFWQGGAGVAACWHGAAVALGRALYAAVRREEEGGGRPDALLRRAALGRVDLALSAAGAVLREAAGWIDAHPRDDARLVALRARQGVEGAARRVLDEVTRALGATPLCRDAAFARHAADLPVFIRQSHGDRDDAALGEQVAGCTQPPWEL